MLLYRSFVVGMLGTIALLIASLPAELAARREAPEEPRAVVTISSSALAASPDPSATLTDLVKLSSGKNVIIVIEP
jgi:hypothetical protein